MDLKEPPTLRQSPSLGWAKEGACTKSGAIAEVVMPPCGPAAPRPQWPAGGGRWTRPRTMPVGRRDALGHLGPPPVDGRARPVLECVERSIAL